MPLAKLERVIFSEIDAEPSARLRTLPGTERYGLRTFPGPTAYHEAVGLLAAHLGAQYRTRLCALAQRDWHVRGQNGCQFARLAAKDAETLRWEHIVATELSDEPGDVFGPQLDDLIGLAVSEPRTQILSLLLPEIGEAGQAVWVIRSLAATTSFWLERDEVTPEGLRLHLRYPVAEGTVQAWVMAFGPFDFLPNTRRGPYFELAIRVKPKPPWLFHRLNQDKDVAHLADAPLNMSLRHWEDRFTSTLRRTRMILGGEPDSISAAKATLVVPTELIGSS
jgi:hypothetical protein